MDEIHNRIKYYRLRSKQSQQQVAKKMGITASNYQKYEYGQRVPTAETLPLLAAALGCHEYSLRESDKERFIRVYSKNLRDMAMRRWDTYSFYAEDFQAYDIGVDIIDYFHGWFNEIEEISPELYHKYFYTTDRPKLLINLAHQIYEIECGRLGEHPEWNEFDGLANENYPAHFWYFILFGHFFLEQYIGETDGMKIATDYKKCLNDGLEEDEPYTDEDAFDEYIHKVFLPFFDYVLTAVEYMVDENASLEQAFEDTLIGGKSDIEVTDFSF